MDNLVCWYVNVQPLDTKLCNTTSCKFNINDSLFQGSDMSIKVQGYVHNIYVNNFTTVCTIIIYVSNSLICNSINILKEVFNAVH